MATSRPDFHIGVGGSTAGGGFGRTNYTPNWGSAVSSLANQWVKSHNKRQAAEGERAMAEQQAQKRGAWAQALAGGATIRDIAARDPSIIGDTAFLAFQSKTETPKGYEDILDDQGRPIAQRGPQGRTFAHPLAPEPEGPEPETWETVQDPYGRGGIAQQSTTTGKFSGYQGPQAQPSPETPFSDKSETERFMNIVSQGDPSSPRYAAAWNRLAQPRVRFDPASGQQISVRPDMSAFRRPTVQAPAGPAGPGGPGPGPATGGMTRVQTGPPKFNEMQARAAQAADELHSSIGILEAPGEDGKPLFNQGTNPLDSINPTAFFKDHDRERYEQSLHGAVQMILRMETGAEAPEHEVQGAMVRYAPRPGDEPETIEQKMTALKRRARSASEIAGQPYEAVKSTRGEIQAVPPAREPATPGIEALAKALGGPPQAQAPARASMGLPASPLSQQRVQDYATLPPDALKRQVADMAEKLAADPNAYPQAEIDAAKIAFDRLSGR